MTLDVPQIMMREAKENKYFYTTDGGSRAFKRFCRKLPLMRRENGGAVQATLQTYLASDGSVGERGTTRWSRNSLGGIHASGSVSFQSQMARTRAPLVP